MPIEEVAARGGVSVGAIRYRVAHGQMRGPDRDGLFDLHCALRELARKPKQSGGRPRGVAPTKLAAPAAGLRRDAADRFRLARARQEELKLRKMREELVEVAAVSRRVFALFRLVRDRLDAWVSRVAPLGAATLGADEGDFWRWMKGEMQKLQQELASLDLDKALAADVVEDESAATVAATPSAIGVRPAVIGAD